MGIFIFLVFFIFIEIYIENEREGMLEEYFYDLNDSLVVHNFSSVNLSSEFENSDLETGIHSDYLHFRDLNITFSMKGLEATERRDRMYNALKILEELVGEFNFTEISNYNKANIKMYFPPMNNLKIIGEALPLLDEYGYIEGGEITMYNLEREGCSDYPDTEIHELLHVFGFDHNPKSIMQEYSEGCKPLNSSWSFAYAEHLKFVYSSGKRGVEHVDLPYLEFDYFCDLGFYPARNDPDSCCPDEGMWVDDFYCYY